MAFKKYYASPHSYLILKIKIDDEWVEQLPLLAQVTEMNDVEELVKTLLSWQLLQEQEAIIQQRQRNIEAERRAEEYWRWKDGQDQE